MPPVASFEISTMTTGTEALRMLAELHAPSITRTA
jgi:hypothetical protein